MTAPADVWAVENPSGKLWSDHDGAPLMWASRELASRARGKRDKVVRFRLVRVDEPEQPQRDEVGELRECVRGLARAIHMEVSGLIDRAKFRAICVDVIDRLTAQSGPAGEVGDG